MDISTRTKINTLINDIQYKLNKRAGHNLNNQNKGNIDINIFKSFGVPEIAKEQEATNSKGFKKYKSQKKENNYINNQKLSQSKNNNIKSPKLNNFTETNNNNINIPLSSKPASKNVVAHHLNEDYIRSLIRDEFSNLISPYQKEIMCNSNLMESKLNEIDKKFKFIINAQNMGNLNENAKIIGAYLCSNFSGDGLNNIEKLKIEYNTLFNEYQKK